MLKTILQRTHNLTSVHSCSRIIPCAGVKNWKPLEEKEIELPPFDDTLRDRRKFRLSMMEKRPVQLVLPENMPKDVRDMRGPEEVHTELLHKQYGIQAQHGGRMKHGHFEMLRNGFNRFIDQKRVFAVWRVDAPWRPIYKKGISVTLGGGRGRPHEYCTPVKTNRIIMEVGGDVEYFELKYLLKRLADKLPFKARPVEYHAMLEEAKYLKELEESNINMFTFKHALENNMLGAKNWASPNDLKWWGKY